MKSKIKLMLTSLILVFGLVLVVSSPALAQDAKTAVCEGVGLTASGGSGCTNPPGSDINTIIRTVLNILTFIVGIVAVIMVIIGGFKYIISSGDANNVSSAKNTILYAIIGLVIVALAQVIVRFVLSKV